MGNALRAIILLAFACAPIGCARFEPERTTPRGPRAVAGMLDLRSWDFAKRGAVSLAGQWDFASAALLDEAGAVGHPGWQTRIVPDFWTHPEGGLRSGTGAGTYRLRVLLSPGESDLAIRNSTGMNAFELEVNGETILRVGSLPSFGLPPSRPIGRASPR